MNCPDVQTRLGLLVDGALDEPSSHDVRSHMTQCDLCRIEFDRLRALAAGIFSARTAPPPAELWNAVARSIESKVEAPAASSSRRLLPPSRAAAAILIVVGLGSLALFWSQTVEQRAEASAVQFHVLLDHVSSNPEQALQKFLLTYRAEGIPPAQARRHAPELNFELKDPLPGGFRLKAVFALRFGESPGIVARYERGGELLVAIFHPPIQHEDFGSHKDYPCVIGRHRGHAVSVGEWKLVHLTDPTTCHCVLSRLDERTELPSVLSAVSPGASGAQAPQSHRHP